MKRTVTERPLVFAHRGAKRVAPENTLPAFEAARRLGADGIELDVQYSSDGKLVIVHDLTLEKTTNGTGRVTARTFEELRELDAGATFGPEFAGTRIPTLDEALETAAGELLVNIELKSLDITGASIGVDVVEVVRRHNMADAVVISSFNPFALRRSRQAGPELEHALLLSNDTAGWTRWELTLRHSRADGVHPELPMTTAKYVQTAHRRGFPVRVWTVNEEADMGQVAAFGVDAIITDAPDVALAVLAAARGAAGARHD